MEIDELNTTLHEVLLDDIYAETQHVYLLTRIPLCLNCLANMIGQYA